MPESQSPSAVLPSIRYAPLRPREFSAANTDSRESGSDLTIESYRVQCEEILKANGDRNVSNSALMAQIASLPVSLEGQFLFPTIRLMRGIDVFRSQRFDSEKNDIKIAAQESNELRDFQFDWVNSHAGELMKIYQENQDVGVQWEIGGVFMGLLSLSEKIESGPKVRPTIEFFTQNLMVFKNSLPPSYLNLFFKKGMIASNTDNGTSEEDEKRISQRVLEIAIDSIDDPASSSQLVDAAFQGLGSGQRHAEDESLVLSIKNYMSRKLERAGLSPKAILDVWDYNYFAKNQDIYPDFIADNFAVIRALETERPGICRVLYREFGVHNFSRYPLKALIDQYDQRDKDLPYGVLIYPHTDNNGGFSKREDDLEEFYGDLKVANTALRIYEAGSKVGVLRRLAAVNKEYGAKNKISFAILGGHGEPEGIEYGHSIQGDKLVSHALHKDDLKGAMVQELKTWFIDKPTFVLVSCSTGADAGIGEEIYKLGGDVIAPQVPSALDRVVVDRRSNGSLAFGVRYIDPDKKYEPEEIYRHFRQKAA